jgi:hypothetical protein
LRAPRAKLSVALVTLPQSGIFSLPQFVSNAFAVIRAKTQIRKNPQPFDDNA